MAAAAINEIRRFLIKLSFYCLRRQNAAHTLFGKTPHAAQRLCHTNPLPANGR